MDILEVIILGIIQGLTEFLPVSSSGHLELVKAIFDNEDIGEFSMMTTVILHFATALSTIVVFRKDVAEILRGLFQFKMNEELIFSLKIILSMLPAAFIGFFFEDWIDALFQNQILLVVIMLLLTGAILFLADKAKDTSKGISFKNALIIGIAQAIAIIPGISRSGATIGTSVLLGIDREKSARFSFLMVVPLIFGKIAKDIVDGAFIGEAVPVLPLSIGFLAAFLTGLAAWTWMIAILKKTKLPYFSVYCFVVSAIGIIWTVI